MKEYRRWGVSAAAVFFVLCITGILFPMMYHLNDDVTMRSILSGAYTGTPDGHAVYMKYPLTGLISLLYRLSGKVPWFSAFQVGFIWLSVTMTLGHLARMAGQIGKLGIGLTACAAFLCGALFLPQAVSLHYTIVAAILGGCGLFLTITEGGEKAVLLFVLCYCVRSQVFFLLLPFLAVILLWLLSEKREWKLFAMPALLSVCILICMVWNGLMYRSEEWRQYEAYNESRTQLYDYHDLLPYEEYAGQYEGVGIGKWDYIVINKYVLALEGGVDAGKLQAASDIYAAKRDGERNPMGYFRFCLAEYKHHTVHSDKPYNYILICAYLLAAALLLWKRRWAQFLLLCCMGAGRSIIWLFLIWQGRFPERIYISLYLIEIMLLAGMICTILIKPNPIDTGSKRMPLPDGKRRKGVSAAIACASGAFSLILLVVGIGLMKTALESAAWQQENQRVWKVLAAYCAENNDNFYLLDTMSMIYYTGEVWEDTSGKANYLLAGGWMSDTPLLQGRIRSLGAEDGGELLARGTVGDTKILYIASPSWNMDWLSEYLSQRFGEIHMGQVDNIMLDGQEIFCVYGAVNR